MIAVRRLTDQNIFRAAVVLGLIAVMLLLASGELFAGHCDADHDTSCEDACTDCDECVRCQTTIHMFAAADFDLPRPDILASWSVPAVSLQNTSAGADGIDRPPQNLL